MSKLRQAMSANHILIFLFSFCFIVCLCGSSQGLPGCDVEVRVRRGTVIRASPQELVEIQCPIHHCGQAVHVIWCKLLDSNICAKLNNSKHIQINESMLSDEKLVSVLRFKRISTEDSGLYTCNVGNGLVGHYINVTVSEIDQRNENNNRNSDQSENGGRDLNNPNENLMKSSSFAYFVIFLSLVLVLLTITVIVLLRIHGKGLLSRKHPPSPQEEQLPSQIIPDLPRRSPPVLHKSLTPPGIVPPPPLPDKTTRPQLETDSAEQSLKYAVYSQIDRTKSLKSLQKNSPGHGTDQINVISEEESQF